MTSLLLVAIPHFKIRTTSEIEYFFVTEGEAALAHATLALDASRIDRYPEEGVSIDEGRKRSPRPLSDFHAELRRINRKLDTMREPPLIEDELTASRLYTGPMFLKCTLPETRAPCLCPLPYARL